MDSLEYGEKNISLPYFLGNAWGDLRISSMVNIALLISEHQLEKYNLGSREMANAGLGWVVTQYHIEVKRMPKIEENAEVFTKIVGYNKFFCYRDFWINDAEGNRLVTISSVWVLIDIEKRKMTKLTEKVFGELQPEVIKGVKLPRIEKYEFLDGAKDIRAGFYDIDYNKHVNNSHYFDWMIDSLDVEFLKDHKVKAMDISFSQEINYDAVVQSCNQIEDTGDGLKSKHVILDAENKYAFADIYWQ